MARIKIVYCCGCGYRTAILEEAVKHSDEKKHTIPVAGEIRKS